VDKLLEELESIQARLAEHQRPVAILFADLKGSTAVFGELSEVEGLLMLKRIEELVRPLVESCGGRVVKTIGDAVMASFPTAREAAEAAVAIQQASEEQNRRLPPEKRLSLRIGINAGKALIKGQDVFGQVVNIAAKVQAAAKGGQILASGEAVRALDKKQSRRARAAGSLEVPGLSRALELYEIAWQEEPEAAPEAVEEEPRPGIITLRGENPISQRLLGGRTITIKSYPFRVGRDPRIEEPDPSRVPQNDLYLEDLPPYRISREHFQIEYEGGRYLVRDRGSKLGLYVNGEPIGGKHPEKTARLVRGANLIVLGDHHSPYRFIITI
jgi:class 3 adenylate cyclase